MKNKAEQQQQQQHLTSYVWELFSQTVKSKKDTKTFVWKTTLVLSQAVAQLW